MATCKAWGLSPSAMRALPFQDQVEMIAYIREDGVREAHIAKVRQRIADEKKPKTKRR